MWEDEDFLTYLAMSTSARRQLAVVRGQYRRLNSDLLGCEPMILLFLACLGPSGGH